MALKFREKHIEATKLNVTNNFEIGGVQVTSTAAEMNYNAAVTPGTVTASKTLIVDANKGLDYLAIGGVVPSTAAVVLAIGATATRATTATGDKNMVEFRTENTATSGDNRGVYNRFWLGGAGGGGESLRTYTTVEDVAAGTAHGAHISLDFGATGSCTGQGIAMRGTLHIPDVAMSGGTYAAVQAELYADGSSSDISGATRHAVWRTVVGGDATGAATAVNFMDVNIPAGMIGTGEMVDTNITTHTAYGGLPIVINGTTRWIALVSA